MEKLVVSTGRRSGVPEKWMGTFQRSVMRKLVTSGLLPIFEIEVVAGGAKSMNVEGGEAVRNCQGDVAGGSETCRPGDREESEIVGLGRMEYYYDQDLEEVVDKFCRTHGVKGKQAKDVWNTVEREARRRGVIPEVEIALDLMDKEKQESHLKNEKWRIYQRRSILESLGGYQEENNKLQRAPRAIVARHLALRRIVPLLIMTLPQVMELGSKPRSLLSEEVMKYQGRLTEVTDATEVNDPSAQNLTLYAGDDFPSHITSFLDVHRLTYGARPKLIARAHHAAILNGVEPVASFHVDLGEYDSSQLGSKGLMPLYLGKTLFDSVSDFCDKHKLGNNTREALLYDAQKLFGISKGRADAVLHVSHRNGKQNDSPIRVPLEEGSNVQEAVPGQMVNSGLEGENPHSLIDGISREATKARVLPALTFRLDVPQGWAPVNIPLGRNMSMIVEDLLDNLGIKERHNAVFCKVARAAIAHQLIPAASAEVHVSVKGWRGPKVMYIDLHDGDDGSIAVQAMEGRELLSTSQKEYLARDLQRRLDDEFSKLPEETVLMILGGVNVSLPIFQGDHWQDAIDRAIEYPVWGDPLTQKEMDLLGQQAKEMFIELGVAPALEFNISMNGLGTLLFPLYVDETVPEAVERFAGIHNLSNPQISQVTKLAQQKAVTAQIIPAFSVNVTVKGGKVPLVFYYGQNIKSTVQKFGNLQGFSTKKIERLIRDIGFRAKRARAVPLFFSNFVAKGVARRVPLYHVDKIGTVASMIVKKHGIDYQKLYSKLLSDARKLRVVPMWSIPLKVNVGLGEERVFLDIYQGDDIDLLVKDFISNRSLSIDPYMVANIVKSQISLGGGDSKGIT